MKLRVICFLKGVFTVGDLVGDTMAKDEIEVLCRYVDCWNVKLMKGTNF